MVRSPLYFTLLLVLGGCATVPLGRGSEPSAPQSSVAPLRPETSFFVVEDKQKPGFQVVKPGSQAGKQKAKGNAAKNGQPTLSPQALQARLQEASDKATSAANVSDGATSKEDWELAIDQWQRAIDLLQGIPNPPVQVRQRLAQYRQQLAKTRQQAQAKLDPKAVKLELLPEDLSNGRSGIVIGGESPKPNPKPSPEAKNGASSKSPEKP